MPKETGDTNQAVRQQTDVSLRAEREKTDRALAERQQAVQDEADTIIAVAREHADAVLDAARDKADEHLDARTGQPVMSRRAVEQSRDTEDAIVQDERDTADETLRLERERTSATLRALIPFEREKTDRHLLTERAIWDDALGNRDDFLGMVSHDLRGLLGGIVNAAAVLAMQASDSEDGRQAVAQAERIQRYAARMNRLICDLVDVASIEAGKLSMSPSEADVAALVTEAAETFAAVAAARGIDLAVEIDERPLHATLDYVRVLQVMTNLVSNAIKFTPDGGRIVVRGARQGGDVQLSVRDSGPGIPKHLLETVFERFWQADPSQRWSLGLGLYISRCIVEAHRGTVWAESPEAGGTTVCLTLPARPVPA
ncbi:HAMP domain-containing sensor histidine kinase [Luteitalea sp.]|uniref:sensor histidine kinase n=1 Tax=Luteitalea sp. TaxID=2004800 RepID=UPI0025BD4E1F|nr:HAMP domain-containing sensor histidine kinase [Luteitalea sp.]